MAEIAGVDWVTEMISERFDNALELMTPNSIVYGGAVRDCLAEKPLLGDLDIAVSEDEFHELSRNFGINPRWVPVKPELFPSKQKSGSSEISRALAPMEAITSFRTINESICQLINSRYEGRDALDDAVYLARNVDIICCGVIMLPDGRVFEVVPFAYDDCKKGVLRLNKYATHRFIDGLPSRVDKLIARGWKNTIDVKKETAKIRRKVKRSKKVKLKTHSRAFSQSAIEKSIDRIDADADVLTRPLRRGRNYGFVGMEDTNIYKEFRKTTVDTTHQP
jgi:hypothetical protein